MNGKCIDAAMLLLTNGGGGGGGGGVTPEQMEAALAFKADKVPGAVAGNLAALDVAGNLVDSGRKPADFGSAKDVEVLYKLTQGQIWDTETDAQAAYQKTVPSGAVAAEIGSIGGKTVVWNQQIGPTDWQNVSVNGVTYTKSPDDGVALSGSAEEVSYSVSTRIPPVRNGDKILILGIDNGSSGSYFLRLLPNDGTGIIAYGPTIGTYGFDTVNSFRIYVANGYTFSEPVTVYPRVVNLTQMFGPGNEPTTNDDPRISAIIAYIAEHPEYDAGSLLSAAVTSVVSKGADAETLGTLEVPSALRAYLADKGYGWSAGNVYNELNLEEKKYIQRIESIDLGTLVYRVESLNEGLSGFSAEVPLRKAGAFTIICSKFVTVNGNRTNITGDLQMAAFNSTDSRRIAFTDFAASEPHEFKAAVSGIILQYELSTPIEYDISSYVFENMLDAEAGGSLTFVQDGTEFPVPNGVEYLIKLSEVEP